MVPPQKTKLKDSTGIIKKSAIIEKEYSARSALGCATSADIREVALAARWRLIRKTPLLWDEFLLRRGFAGAAGYPGEDLTSKNLLGNEGARRPRAIDVTAQPPAARYAFFRFAAERGGGPGQSRTADQRFRKPLLYPSELRGHRSTSLSHVDMELRLSPQRARQGRSQLSKVRG